MFKNRIRIDVEFLYSICIVSIVNNKSFFNLKLQIIQIHILYPHRFQLQFAQFQRGGNFNLK
jgi:hypothetical protein